MINKITQGNRGAKRPQAQKKQAVQASEIDLEAVTKMKDRLAEIAVLPKVELSNELPGIEDLDKIMPDSWHNIPWVV